MATIRLIFSQYRVLPRWLLVLLMLGAFAPAAWAGNACVAKTTGNWNAAGTWKTCGGTYPGSSDTATISNASYTVTLTANASASAVTVSAGTLDILTHTMSANTVTLSGGTIAGTGGGTLTGTSYALQSGTISAKLAGSGVAATKTTSGTVTLTGSNSYTGGTNINDGTINFVSGSLGSSGDITFGGGTLQYASGNTQDISSRLKNSTTGAITIDTNGNSVTYASVIDNSNTDGVVLNDSNLTPGRLAFSGANTFTGGLTIKGGTVIGSTSTSAFGGSGTGTITLGDSAGGSKNATIQGSSYSTFANPIVLASNTTGTLTIGLSGYGPVFSGDISGTNNLTINNTEATSHTITLTGSMNNTGTVTNAGTGTGGDVIISGVIGTNVTGVIQNSTTSRLTLKGNNTFTGGLTIKSGTVVGMSSANAFGGNGTGTIILGDSAGGSNDATILGSAYVTFANPIVLASNTTGTLAVGATGYQPVFSGGITGNHDLTISQDSVNPITFSTESINNQGSITSTGSGVGAVTISAVIGSNVTGVIQNSSTSSLILSGTNTYNGPTTISAGTLQEGAADVIPDTSAVSVVSGATYDLKDHSETIGSLAGAGTVTSSAAGSVTLTTGGDNTSTSFTGLIQNGSGTVTLTKAGSGTFTVSDASNAYTGGTNINDGTINFVSGSLGSSGNITFGGTGTLQYASSNTQDISSRLKDSTAGPIEIDTNGNNVTYASVIDNSNTDGFILNDTNATLGQLTLWGANTFTGGLTIKSGTVEGAVADAFGGSGTGTVTLGDSAGGSNNATLEAGSSNLTFANPIVLASNTTGALSIRNISNGYTQTYTGGVTGTNNLIISGTESAAYNSLIFSTGAIDNTGTVTNLSTGTGSITINSVIGSNVTGVIQNSGTATLTLSGNNTFTGGLTVKNGFVLGNSASGFGDGTIYLGDGTNDGNSASVGGSKGGSGLTYANPIVLVSGTTGTMTLSDSSGGLSTFSGGVTGTGNLTLVDSNSNGNGLTISTGSVNNVGTITNSSSGTTGVKINSVIGTNVTGLIQNGSGPLTLSGVNTYTGPTTISAGTLSVSADDNLGADPGSATPGNITINGGTLAATNTFTLNANRGISLGASSGTVDVSSGKTLTYGGTIAGSGSLTKTSAGTLTLSTDQTLGGDLTLSAGTLTAPSNLNVAGNMDLSGGTLTNNSGTVTLNGSNGQSITTGSNTYNNLTVTNASASGVTFTDGFSTANFTDITQDSVLKFQNASTYTLSGTLTLTGAASHLISLNTDDGAASNFIFDVTGGIQSVSYLDVSRADASSHDITCDDCINGETNNSGSGTASWVLPGTGTTTALFFGSD